MTDASLDLLALMAHIQGELARERVALQTAQDEAAHWRQVAETLGAKVEAMKKANRGRV